MATDASPASGVREFHASMPTHLVAGSGCSARVGQYAASFGTRALIVAGESHARSSGLLARVTAAIRSEGLSTELLEGVGANPGVAVVDVGASLARSWCADVVVAVGGGSVVDVAKAIATSAAAADARSFATHLSGQRAVGLQVHAALPVVAVSTMPGSGSETNGTSVIVDEASGRKLSAHSDLAAPRIALLDPDLLLDADPALLAPGLVDGWCHALEAALSTRATIASWALSEQALRMLQRSGPELADAAADRDLRAVVLTEAWWATNLAGQALTLAGSIVTHPLAHPLSARLDARHGEAVAALESAVLAGLAERFLAHEATVRVARWLDVRGAEDPQVALRGLIHRLGRFCTRLGVRSSAAELGLSEQLVAEVVRDARASGSRGLANVPGGEPSAEELFHVLDLARAPGPTASARSLLAAAAAG